MLSEENVKIWSVNKDYSVSRYGFIIYTKTRHILTHYFHKGYYSVNIKVDEVPSAKPTKFLDYGFETFKTTKGLVKRVGVHRIVAEMFCENNDPENKTEVNHIDGNPSNNRWDNLEWVTPSENIRHSVKEGLRLDNVRCRIRDYETGGIIEFPSVAEAKRYMGVPINTRTINLIPKRFGQLIKDRWEFRFINDPRPWFYENRTRKVSSKHLLTVTYPDGSTEEFFKVSELPLKFGKLPSVKTMATMPEMVNRARLEYPELKFDLRYAHDEDLYPNVRKYIPADRTKILACNSNTKKSLLFNGLTETAAAFGCSNKSIRTRLGKLKSFKGEWYFALATEEKDVKALKIKLDLE